MLVQEDVAIEVIVVDDASTDETFERLSEFDDARVRTLRNETPQGVASARNRAIDLAHAPWLGFLDDDDVWAPRKLCEQLDRVTDDVVLLYCGRFILDEQGRVLARYPGSEDPEKQLLRWNAVGSPSGVIARTELVRSVGGFDQSLAPVEDWDLWVRLLGLGRMVACPEPLYAYTLHSGAASSNSVECLAATKRLLAKHASLGLDIDLALSARWIAGGQRRAGRRLEAVRTLLSSGLHHRNGSNFARGVALFLLGESGIRAQVHLRQPRLEEPNWLDVRLEGIPLAGINGPRL